MTRNRNKIVGQTLLMMISLLLCLPMATAQSVSKSLTSQGQPLTNKTFFIAGCAFKMMAVEGGTFKMGAQSSDPNQANYNAEADPDEQPVHTVTVSTYWIGETEVTQALWKAVGMPTPYPWTKEYGIGDNMPVYNVSDADIQQFLDSLNAKVHRANLIGANETFCLPTEAQWEYAARGGKKSKGYIYSGSNEAEDVAWSRLENEGIQPVGTKKPNELGLYDMSGNVYEWCADRYYPAYYKNSPEKNPTGPNSGSVRVLRGGSWYYMPNLCRVANRYGNLPSFGSADCGLRIVLTEKR